MVTTKITMKVDVRLAVSLNERLEQCHLKRDAFLHHMIKSQISSLDEDLRGLCVSKVAKRYISGKLARADYKTISIVVQKTTAKELNEVVKRHNLVRDAFFNRLILFLICPDILLRYLELPTIVGDASLRDFQSLPISPLACIAETLSDPLYYIREALSDAKMDPIYRVSLPGNLDGFSCFMADEDVPGTPEYAQQQEDSQKLLNSLFNTSL